MTNTANTKLIGRFADTPNTRGLNIYNPYFEEAGVDAIYKLFVTDSAEKLLLGTKYLGISGGIVVGKHSEGVLEYVDHIDPHAAIVGSCNTIVNTGAVITAYSTDAEGMLGALEERVETLENARITILGSGKIVRGLLDILQHRNLQTVTIFNRTPENLERLQEEFPFIVKGGNLTDLVERGSGDIFINATCIGSDWEGKDKFIFPDKLVQKFSVISDVTFEPLEPQLIKTATQLGKIVSPGWLMFLHQGIRQLSLVLNHKTDRALLERKIKEAFRKE